jgi:four helix bundle protein
MDRLSPVEAWKMKIQRFEDLLAWQEARVLTRAVYQHTAKGSLARDFGLRDQLQRAAVSVMSNTAEGFERTGRLEKLQFMNIARASCAEVKSLLYVCADVKSIDAGAAIHLQSQCTQISRLLSGLMRSVSTRSPGSFAPAQAPSSDSDSEH